MKVCEAYDVACTIHTDTLNESGCVEETIRAIGGRTIHTYARARPVAHARTHHRARTRMHAHARTCMYARARPVVHARTRTPRRARTHAHAPSCTHARARTHTRTRTNTQSHPHANARKRTRMHAHNHTRTHARALAHTDWRARTAVLRHHWRSRGCRYHTEGAGGGHAPDIITVCGLVRAPVAHPLTSTRALARTRTHTHAVQHCLGAWLPSGTIAAGVAWMRPTFVVADIGSRAPVVNEPDQAVHHEHDRRACRYAHGAARPLP